MATKSKPRGGSDNTLLIATDDGKIYRVVGERWRIREFELGGDAANFLKKNLLKNGVVAAHLPTSLIEPAFACFLLNLSMIKEAPVQTPRKKASHGKQTRTNEGTRKSGQRRPGT